MGTNIYLVRQITKKEIKETQTLFNSVLHNLETSRDTSKILEPLQEHLEKLKEEIHICKRSYGWQLLFQSHKELYDCTWKSMINYIKKVLNNGTYIMVDEYGELYSLDDLKKDLESFKDGYTGKTYDEECRKNGEYNHINCADYEYISDGLRWTDSDFN